MARECRIPPMVTDRSSLPISLPAKNPDGFLVSSAKQMTYYPYRTRGLVVEILVSRVCGKAERRLAQPPLQQNPKSVGRTRRCGNRFPFFHELAGDYSGIQNVVCRAADPGLPPNSRTTVPAVEPAGYRVKACRHSDENPRASRSCSSMADSNFPFSLKPVVRITTDYTDCTDTKRYTNHGTRNAVTRRVSHCNM